MQRQVCEAAPAAGIQDRSDRSAWAWTLALTFGLIVATIVWSCLLGPAVHHLHHRWWIPGDAWVPLPAAHFIVWGAFPSQYSAGQGFVYLPGLSILLAPIAALGDHLQLSETIRGVVLQPRPSMWLLFGSYGAALSIIPIRAMRSLWTSVGVVRSRTAAQIALVIVALGPVVVTWGHFEEVAVLGFVLIATRLSLDGRHLGAALALAAAILCKQSALLVAPVLLFRVPRPIRVRACAYAFGPALLLGGICLAMDWADASRALLFAHSYPQLGRAALWAAPASLVSTPFRVVALGLATFVGYRVRDGGAALTLAGLAVASVLRLGTEPVLFAYYMAVPIVLVVTADLVGQGGNWRRDVVLGAATSALFMTNAIPPTLWWLVFAAGVLAMVQTPLRLVVRGVSTEKLGAPAFA